jgi:threonine dehydrogenase-like Zn-dependent dehydrogenase
VAVIGSNKDFFAYFRKPRENFNENANLDFMVTHRFDFTQTQKAFDLVAGYKDGEVKVIVKL